jgi:hypothetical protein
MGEKIFWCDGIRYVLAESWLKGCTGRTVFYKIFWCEEIVCYGYDRSRTEDLFLFF